MEPSINKVAKMHTPHLSNKISDKNNIIRSPTLKELDDICKKYGLHCTEEDLIGYQKTLENIFKSFQPLNDYAEPCLPVKYPRTPGYRPSREENKSNAWYWKCQINGAASGKLLGKKIVLKDNIAVAGVPMMNGSKLLEGYVPEFDATVVTRILDAGGTIVGKAVCEDMCLSTHSFTAATGPIPNPYNPDYSVGGSSSGCAFLVSTEEADMAIGGDQGGSIRIPCSYCGLVGLKPTHGLVPYTGAVAFEPSIDHLGPMTRTVYDAALFLEVLAGSDGYDHRQKEGIVVPEYTKLLSADLNGIKIGLLKEGFDQADVEILELIKEQASRLVECGATVDDVSIPIHKIGADILTPVGILGGAKSLRSGDFKTSGFGYSETSLQKALFQGFKTHLNDAAPPIKALLMMGEFVENNHGNYFYSKAQNMRRVVREAYDNALKNFDVLIMPTLLDKNILLPNVSKLGVEEYMKLCWTFNLNTESFNYTGHPVLSINAGFINNLPIGLSIVGRHFEETTVLRVAYAFEQTIFH